MRFVSQDQNWTLGHFGISGWRNFLAIHFSKTMTIVIGHRSSARKSISGRVRCIGTGAGEVTEHSSRCTVGIMLGELVLYGVSKRAYSGTVKSREQRAGSLWWLFTSLRNAVHFDDTSGTSGVQGAMFYPNYSGGEWQRDGECQWRA